jgi:type IV pilus assembly protein PilA
MLHNPSENSKGFTLIELMIVIAIIGILAAIAIPNFIAYRDKAFCSAAETDVDFVMGAIADYFSNPENMSVSQSSPGMPQSGVELTSGNTYTISGNTGAITVEVTDVSQRCPRFPTHTISKTM